MQHKYLPLSRRTCRAGNTTPEAEISACLLFFQKGKTSIQQPGRRQKNGNGRKHTADQLKAGDFNGNGKLDNADYQALREQLKEKRVL